MKRIVLFITAFVMMLPLLVKAESANLVSNRYDGNYVYYYDASLGKSRYLEASKYSFNGKAAYCLEIGKRINSLSYEIFNSFDNILLNADDLEYIKVIAYYGYNYPGHQTDKFYMATQTIIWTRLIRTNIKWTNGFNPDSFVYFENEKEVIYDLYRKHYRKPSFDNEEVTITLGKDSVIHDDNGVLYLYESKTKGTRVNGNDLIIDSDYDGKEIILKRINYNSDSFLLYVSGNSQKMMTTGSIPLNDSKVRVNLISGSVSIHKYDSDTKSSTYLHSGKLDGSVYGLYDSDNRLIDKFVIGKKEKISKLGIGKYYIKELLAGEGYLLDEKVYEVNITEDSLDISIDLYDKVMERRVDLFKVLGSDETGIMTGEEGISFDIFNSSGNKISTITTDSEGYASIVLPYGEYVFHQVNSSYGYYKVDDFTVNINSNDSRSIYRLLSDGKITSRIRVIKKDSDSLDNIVNSKIRFKIFDVKNDCFISYKMTYPKDEVTDEFVISDDGTFISPFELDSGEYILYEVDDYMEGYVYNKEGIRFVIDESTNFINDSEYGMILEIPFYNKRVRGNIIINKYGEDIVYEDNSYFYKDIYLDDVSFELYADGDIYENGKLVYLDNSLVGSCITDDGGVCKYSDLPLGNYVLKEIKSSNGNVISKDSYDIELKYKDQYTDVINYEMDVFNYLKKGKVVINKYDSSSLKRLSNTLIEIRNKDDRVVYKGYTDSNGEVVIDDLVYGDYYISEVEASSGYRLLLDDVYFTLDKDEVSIDLYNDRISVPNTGKSIGILNALIALFLVLFVILLFVFWSNKFIRYLLISGILVCALYLGYYFYYYFGDDVKNERAIVDFFDKKIDDKYDEKYRYTSVIEIPSIGLKRGTLDISNEFNDVKYNIELMRKGDDKIIFASHSGNYYYSYFGKLKDMELGDDILYYDNDRIYRFIYSESYVIKKDGYADIYCDNDKKCIVLITCLEENDDAQIAYIGYLKEVMPYSERE